MTKSASDRNIDFIESYPNAMQYKFDWNIIRQVIFKHDELINTWSKV